MSAKLDSFTGRPIAEQPVQYIFFSNDQEFGPFDFSVLKAYEETNHINDETKVRFVDSAVWRTWKEIHTLKEEENARTRQADEEARQRRSAWREESGVASSADSAGQSDAKHYSPGMPGVREKLRGGTAYPVLRGCLIGIIVIGILGAVASFIALFNDDARPLGITGIIACLSSIFSSFVTMVILDGVDSLLAKHD